MAIDPVCGMEVDVDDASISETLGDSVFFFCCESCREEFRESPEQYADAELAFELVPEG
jgi:YHS domain-containing protein